MENELLVNNLAWAERQALLFSQRRLLQLDADEVVQHGRIGLWQAAQRFRPDCGVRFRTFAYRRIIGAVLDLASERGNVSRAGVRRPRLVALSVDPGRPGPFAGIELREALLAATRCLSDRDRRIVVMYYLEGLTMLQVARAVGLSESAISLRLPKVVGRLRDWFVAHRLNPLEQGG